MGAGVQSTQGRHRQVIPEVLEFIKRWEGLRLEAYLCPAGVWTIGYGHTRTARPGMKITVEEAERLLVEDLRPFERFVQREVKVPLNDWQFGALVSWVFNVGPGAAARSTLLRKLNEGDYAAVPAELMKWNKVRNPQTGVLEPSRGLTNRRAAEAGMWVRTDFVAGREVVPESAEPRTIADVLQTDTMRGTWAMSLPGVIGPILAGFQGLDWRFSMFLVAVAAAVFAGVMFWRKNRS